MYENPQPPVLNWGGLNAAYKDGMVPDSMTPDDWLQRGRSTWVSSTDWFDSSIRAQIRRNLANFRSVHPEGSKYRSDAWKARSRTFRPKSRANVRRGEASIAVALFATSDLISITSYDQSNQQKLLFAKIKQKLLQYRLESRDMAWFLTVIGAKQDADVTGVCISHQYWKWNAITKSSYGIYKSEYANGRVEYDLQEEQTQHITENRPACDLIPIENFRFDASADWRDPIRDSPFVTYACPTYVGEAKEMVKSGYADALIAAGLNIDNSMWWALASDDYDSLRQMREGNRIDKYAEKKDAPDAETLWIRKHISRVDGEDWYWETIGDIVMFKSPRPLLEVYPHLKRGDRPFTMGFSVVETHKVYPSGTVQLGEQIQDEINDVANLQLDTVKMSTFGRWLVRRNSMTDVSTLKQGIPQSVIGVDDVNADVKELKQADVPRGGFTELDRLQTDLDDVLGNFSPASAQANKQLNETIGGLNLLSSDASQIKEMEARTFVETWAEPTLQQIYDMECTYESDEDVINDVCATVDVPQQLLMQALKQRSRVRINVGFNATSPEKRIGRLTMALHTLFQLFPNSIQSANQQEIRKEIFGAVGFDDGERFFPSAENVDPEVQALRQQVAELTQQLSGKTIEAQAKVQAATITAISRERVANITGQIQYDIALLAHGLNVNQAQLDAIDRQIAAQGASIEAEQLQLERTALLHSMDQDQKLLALKLHQALNGGNEQDVPGKDPPPAMRAPNRDGAGTIEREHYGQIPFQEG